MSEAGLEIPPGLVAHFRQHNRRALLLAFGCLLGSVASWSAVYGILLWTELLFLTITRGVEAPAITSTQSHFLVVAAVLCVIGSRVRKWKTQDEKFHLGLALAALFSIPARLTFAVWENLLARASPSEAEFVDAWLVLEILREEKKIPRTNLSALLRFGADAGRITYLLAITGLIDTDDYGGIYYLHLRNEEAIRLVRRWSRARKLKD